MHQVSVKTRFPIMILLLLSLCACQPVPSLGLPPQATPTPQVTIQGDNAGREEIQTIELDNCDGKGDAIRIEQRSQSVEVTISAEIAAKLGASAEVISAEVQTTVSASTTKGAQRSTSIQLSAPPQTRMLFQLIWTGKEQVGVVQNLRGSNIPIAFRGFTPTDVRIKNQSDIGCPGSGADAPKPVVATPGSVPQPSPTSAQPAACTSYTVGSTEAVVPAGLWVTTRTCRPANNDCVFTVERSQGGKYSTYEHNGPADRRWVNVFCTEVEAKKFANDNAKAMLQWWASTNPIPFPESAAGQSPGGGASCDQNPIVSESAVEGTKKTYVRCPVGDVEYVIQPDDFLMSIVLDCPDTGQQSIAFKKNEQLSQGEFLAVYDSARFTSRQSCRVYITIVNTVSNLMGYRLRQELR